MRATLTFHVHPPGPGRFLVRVGTVSDRARLRFTLDGQPAGEWNLSAAPPADPLVKPGYASTEFKPQWHVYQARFDRDYGIDLPPGEHRTAAVRPHRQEDSVDKRRPA